jgi:hypothetical protein
VPITPLPEDRARLRAEQEREAEERKARIHAQIWGQPATPRAAEPVTGAPAEQDREGEEHKASIHGEEPAETSPPADPEPDAAATGARAQAPEPAEAEQPTSSATDPQAPGEPPRGEHARRANGAEEPPLDLPSDLDEWDAGQDLDPIPPRGWLLGNSLCRGFLSSVMAAGGTGKTALRIAQALALATGRPLTGEYVFQRCRVLYVSLEDDRDELRRRVRAAMKHHKVDPAHVRGWLYLATPAARLQARLD